MGNTLTSIERSYKIVNTVKDMSGARVSELASELDTPQSTIYKHLATLEDLGYLTSDGGVYHVGLKYLNLGGFARNRHDGFQQAIPLVESLAEAAEERAQFLVEEGGVGIYLYTESPDTGVRTDRHVGQIRHLHASAAGKAILAHSPPSYTERIIGERGLPAETRNTITDPEAFREELAEIRERGVAFNDEESIGGLRGVGVAVTLPNDRVLGAFSVAGPANRLKGDVFRKEIPDLLLGHVNELELNLAY